MEFVYMILTFILVMLSVFMLHKNNEMKNFCNSNDWAEYIDITSGLHDDNGYLKEQDTEGIHLVGDGKTQLVKNIKSQVVAPKRKRRDHSYSRKYKHEIAKELSQTI